MGKEEKSIRSKSVEIKHVYKTYDLKGQKLNVLEDVNVSIQAGEFVSIVGQSGCGKSTLLRQISGLELPSNGEVCLGDKKITKPSLECGMIFQEARLFPWLNVEKNVRFGLPKKKQDGEKDLVAENIGLVGLKGFEKALPMQLSGGMQQRCSIARALVNNPSVLLLDEPFGALDAFTKINMQKEIMRIWEVEHTTMILVTHDIDEAVYLSDRIIVMGKNPGTIRKIINVDLPRERDRTSADFIRVRKEVFDGIFYLD